MRILHTSDWHIGRTFHGHATLDALRGVLETLTAQVRENEVDVVVVAGDVGVPRADIIAVEEATPFPELVRIFAEAGHSRLPVYRGKLDHIVGGGVPAGLDADAALLKEAEEEASLPADLARRACRVAVLSYAMERPEGLRRDRLHCYDLDLPDAFTPRPADGEVDGFELWPLPAVLDRVRRTDDFKFNVNLVLLDLFLREGLIDPAGEEGRRLRAGLDAA